MATLAPRPGPAVIQRANSLQASDTSHTSHTSTASTTSTTDASTNTSASHSKPSPVSSIGESISSVVHQPVLHLIPPARSARPLPIPPSLSPPTSPGLTSTSTLKLSHQESQSTLGKSSQANLHKPTSNSTVLLTKSKNAPARKPSRVRPDPDAVTQPPPPSAFVPRRMSDDGWVSVSVMPVLTERQPDGRLHEPNHSSYAKPSAVSSGKRSASASRAAKSAAKPASGSAKSAARTASKSLPRLPQSDSPASRPPPPPQPQDNAWKLEFRGVVRLVRWVSRRDKDKRDSAVWDVNENDIPDHDGTQDEKLVVEEIPAPASRKGFSISNEARRSRDSYKQPAPNRNAPPGGLGPVKARPSSMVRLQPKLEGENDGNTKRRLSKSNPGLVNFVLGSTTSDRTEISQRTRTSTDAGIRRSVDTGRRTSSDAGLGLGISSNGGGVFVPDAPLNVPATDAHPPRSSSLHAATSVLHTFDANVTSPNAGLSGQAEMSADISQTDRFGEGDDTITFLPGAPFSSLPYRQGPISSASQVTTVTRTTTAHTTTTVVQTPPFSITSPQSLLPATTHSYALSTSHSTLSPVLEAPLFSSELAASPPEIGAGAGGFPWNGMNRGVVQVGEIVPSESVIFRGGLEAAAAATHVTTQLDNAQVETVVTEVVGPAPIAAMDAFTKSIPSVAANSVSTTSSSSGSLSPLASTSASVSPLMSNSVSPLMSAVASASASPVIPSNAHLSDPYMSAYTPATTAASSLSYATARSNRNSLPAAQAIFENHAGGLQTTVDPVVFEQPGRSNEASYVLRTGASTDIGHGCSTRATSPSPSDRYAFSEDPHGSRPSGGILRTLSSIGHSDAPLPMPRRPFLPGRGSSGSVTFDDSSTQSSPRLGGRRKMMTMSASDVRQSDRLSAFLNGNHYANTRSPRPEVHRSKSSLSITGRIIRRLSIGSSSNAPKSNGAESETDRPRVTRKLTRRKSQGRTGNGSSVSLPYADGLNSVPPVPPLPPGVSSGNFGRRAQSEVGHGALSDIGHGVQSEIGHGYGHSRGDSLGGHSTWEGSTSVLGHESTTSHAISPAPTRVSFTTTQSAPASSYGRNKLVKKNRRAPRRVTESDALRRSLASVEYPNEPVSRDPPRITTEFEHARLSLNGNSLSAGTDGVTDEGHLMPPRPGMPRRTSSQRRWTIADIDDDEFLRQLEAKLSGTGSRLRKSRVLEEFAMGADQSHEDPEAEIEPDPGSETDDSAAEREWIKARRAMMCVREIVRTEKSYLRHMVGFSEGNESMSPILLEHIPRLIETSRTFMARLEEDPSAWGVSSAFLDVEEQLEAAFVEWSGVVGHVILSKSSKAESQAPSEDGHTSSAGSGSATSSWMRRRSATASSSSAQPFQLNLSMTPVIGSKGKKSNRSANSKRLTEQDWAIMPTQRVLRYVMMYRELLHYTPAKSASRPLVERALQGATRIAQLCNDAQTHVDILSPS